MQRSQLASELPKFKDRLFGNKQEALDSGLEGTVYIGSPAVHSVCSINVKENKETGESTRSVQYIWTRNFWEEKNKNYTYLVETATDGSTSYLEGVRSTAEDAFKLATEVHADSVTITKYDAVSGEELCHYGYRWNQKPDFERCKHDLKEGN